jgi:hypothetical protein
MQGDSEKKAIRVRVVLCICCTFLLASCTVQNSGSVSDSLQSGRDKHANDISGDGMSSRTSSASKKIRADYLRSVEAIHDPIIVVQKEKRRLYLFDRQVLVRDYPVALGWSPVGDKEKKGDGRTPEGEFYICGKADEVATRKYVLISYPSRKHVERAQFQGIMSTTGAQSILNALEKKIQPPGDTALGDSLGIRAGGAHGDWTDGSVALYDSDMAELHKIVQLGTRVHIRP